MNKIVLKISNYYTKKFSELKFFDLNTLVNIFNNFGQDISILSTQHLKFAVIL